MPAPDLVTHTETIITISDTVHVKVAAHDDEVCLTIKASDHTRFELALPPGDAVAIANAVMVAAETLLYGIRQERA